MRFWRHLPRICDCQHRARTRVPDTLPCLLPNLFFAVDVKSWLNVRSKPSETTESLIVRLGVHAQAVDTYR